MLIYLLPSKTDPIPVHETYEDSANDKIELSMRNGRFEPHMLLLRTSQIMTLENHDTVGHNPKTAFGSNAPL